MTSPIVHTYEKKAFIYWFLNQYEMKTQESNWILTYLANNSDLLKHVHFVRHANACPRAIIISSNCSEGVAFRFYRKQLATSDPDKAFHDIRLNVGKPLYIELNFHRWKQCPQYALILEDNPFLPDDFDITQADKKRAEKLIEFLLLKRKKEELLSEIDKTLDMWNKIRFMELTGQLKNIESQVSKLTNTIQHSKNN